MTTFEGSIDTRRQGERYFVDDAARVANGTHSGSPVPREFVPPVHRENVEAETSAPHDYKPNLGSVGLRAS